MNDGVVTTVLCAAWFALGLLAGVGIYDALVLDERQELREFRDAMISAKAAEYRLDHKTGEIKLTPTHGDDE